MGVSPQPLLSSQDLKKRSGNIYHWLIFGFIQQKAYRSFDYPLGPGGLVESGGNVVAVGGLIVVGSYVPKTTAQLTYLLKNTAAIPLLIDLSPLQPVLSGLDRMGKYTLVGMNSLC